MVATSPVDVERSGEVTVISLDDGKANALSPPVIDALLEALGAAADAPGAVVVAGRPGRFCAGFDLSVMTAGAESARDLLRRGTELLLAMYGHPRPVVAAVTGHALAAGALMLLASDLRIGAAGDYKIGLNEHAIGMPLPAFAVELARDRLSRRHFTRATALAEIYAPAGAVDAGYLDEVSGPTGDATAVAIGRAEELSGGLDMTAFAATRRRVRGPTIESVRAGLDGDLSTFRISG